VEVDPQPTAIGKKLESRHAIAQQAGIFYFQEDRRGTQARIAAPGTSRLPVNTAAKAAAFAAGDR
jgi:hypothetical protein